ncbi:MAG: 1,2-phenylacetyl-CoA epoxidase subunit PaaD [Bacteroidota bacterium]|nr:1,2-phenylacetyl-CoA epoxidase subunit PaaD [Bacteroidota bacterium]
MTDAQRIERVWTMVRTVHDPELPYLTVEEMGMVRGVTMRDNQIVVSLTPTYSGCPATDVISEDVANAVKAVEPEAHVEVVLSPAWTTDWILPSAYEKMRAHGIAPPEGQSADRAFLTGQGKVIPCPRCKSKDTLMVSAFGSTACKAHFKCNACLEPFEHFKCI